jgi:membrane-bound lytic murein transglycosylase A
VPFIPFTDRAGVLAALRESRTFVDAPSSANWYPRANLTREQILHSLERLEAILRAEPTDAGVNAAIQRDFRAFMSIGCDDEGTVLFTGYYTPVFLASRTHTETYRYPLYRRPADLIPKGDKAVAEQRLPNGGTRPYPTANEIEDQRLLAGQELVWLADPYDVYLIRVQGSARLTMTDGSTMDVGFAGTNGHEYVGIGSMLVADGKIPRQKLSFFTMRDYFRRHPQEVATYTRRNPRYVFFAESGDGIRGCLNRPVTRDVSIATDKDVFPPAGPVVVVTSLSTGVATSTTDTAVKPINYTGMRFDQDRGGAIRAPGRCDLYMGIGEAEERRAGGQYAEGKMYYLIAK